MGPSANPNRTKRDIAAGQLSITKIKWVWVQSPGCLPQRARAKADRRARAVDAKASKGRKVRYDVHAKLVNFMAPGWLMSKCSVEIYCCKKVLSVSR